MTPAAVVMLAHAQDGEPLFGVALVCGSLFVGGFAAVRARSRAAAWMLALSALLATLYFVDNEPAGVRMVAIVATMLLGMKAVVASNGEQTLSWRQWIAFTLWPGMRPLILPSRVRARARARAFWPGTEQSLSLRAQLFWWLRVR